MSVTIEFPHFVETQLGGRLFIKFCSLKHMQRDLCQ